MKRTNKENLEQEKEFKKRPKHKKMNPYKRVDFKKGK